MAASESSFWHQDDSTESGEDDGDQEVSVGNLGGEPLDEGVANAEGDPVVSNVEALRR